MEPVTTREIRIPGVGELQAWLSRPTSVGRYPALVLLHQRPGASQGFKDVAVRFAENGIIALGLNYMTYDPDPSDADVLLGVEGALAYLQNDAEVRIESIALGGYCKGGGLTYLGLARCRGYAAGLVWHGGLYGDSSDKHPDHPGDAALRVSAPIAIFHGASDKVVPIDQVYALASKLNEAGKNFELKVYSGCDHAFTLPDGRRHVPWAGQDAFREAVSFLRRTFGLPTAQVGPLGPESHTAQHSQAADA